MLPELPKKLNKLEAEWTTNVFKKWALSYKQTFAFEIKHTHGKDYLNFKDVKDHQIDHLLQVRNNIFIYKIPDMGEKNPFDGISMHEEPAYVVIKYPKFFCLISINTFLLEKERSKKKSLTSSRATEIAVKVIHR